MIDLKNLTITKAHQAFSTGEFTVSELCEAYLKEIEATNPNLNAYLEVFADVKEQAKSAQKRFAAGDATKLTGIPFAIKDNILINGRKASAASKILENFVSPYDATVIKKLKDAGAVFLGRANMDEFAMGGSTENSAYGVTKNPFDDTRVAGGSSGGSAAAVGANLSLAALGSDTGGSIRQPASFCGVVGLKPTYGRISRFGVMAMAASLNQIGPIGKSASDTETIFNFISGSDPLDNVSISEGIIRDLVAKIKKPDGDKMVIGVPRNIVDQEGVDKSVKDNFEVSLKKLSDLGYEIKDVELPNVSYALAIYYIIMPAEVSSDMGRYDGIRYGAHKDGQDLIEDYFKTRATGFGPEVKRRIMLGTYVLSSGYYDAYYDKANQLRELIRSDLAKAFEQVDVIATPTSPVPAFKIGEKTKDPLSMYLADVFTVTANIAGVPGISLPSGMIEADGKNLPAGLQLMAPHCGEETLFTIGKKFLGEI